MNPKKTNLEDTSIRVVRAIGSDEPMKFEVAVQGSSGEILYQVTMSHSDFERLGGENPDAEKCVRAVFLFLLSREPKESILRRFDISVIEGYFPEFPREFPRYRDG